MELEELVRRIRFGDKTAIKDLISIYGNSVYARAFERTQDKELAREAARQTFGQFVSIVQQQPDEDGWSLWFGDLIERNITAYAQVGSDMSVIESELERELYDTPEPAAAWRAPRAAICAWKTICSRRSPSSSVRCARLPLSIASRAS